MTLCLFLGVYIRPRYWSLSADSLEVSNPPLIYLTSYLITGESLWSKTAVWAVHLFVLKKMFTCAAQKQTDRVFCLL